MIEGTLITCKKIQLYPLHVSFVHWSSLQIFGRQTSQFFGVASAAVRVSWAIFELFRNWKDPKLYLAALFYPLGRVKQLPNEPPNGPYR